MGADLTVTELSVRRGGRPVIERLSFTVKAGELLLLTGRNGSGKTTLLRALALLVPSDTGTIAWAGADVALDRDAWRARVGWLGHSDGVKGDLTAAENLRAAQRLQAGVEPDRADIDRALVAFDLATLADRPSRALSAGQRRRVALSRVVLGKAELWLLDEPLNALDAPAQQLLTKALAEHLARGGKAIAATHAPLQIAGARTLELSA
jgi:heme exporter protein A